MTEEQVLAKTDSTVEKSILEILLQYGPIINNRQRLELAKKFVLAVGGSREREILKQILQDLPGAPGALDWLDPDLEREGRALVGL